MSGSCNSTRVENTTVVPSVNATLCETASKTAEKQETSSVTAKTRHKTSTKCKTGSSGVSGVTSQLESITQHYLGKSLTEQSVNIIMSSWRESTQKQYKVYIDKWSSFAQIRNVNILKPDISVVLEFLNKLYEDGYSYSSINSACSSLSALMLPIMKFL